MRTNYSFKFIRLNYMNKNQDSLANFIELKKYGLVQTVQKQIAERLSSSRGVYLSKTEKDLIRLIYLIVL